MAPARWYQQPKWLCRWPKPRNTVAAPDTVTFQLTVAQWRHMALKPVVYINSSDGLLPKNTKPFLKPMVVYLRLGHVQYTSGTFQ